MTFTRYKLVIGGENEFSFHPMRIFQFFTNLKKKKILFSSRTQHGSPITQNILTVEFMQVATRQQHLEIHSQNGTLYIYQSLLREAWKVVYFFFKTLKLVPNSLDFVRTCCRWQSVQYLAHASNYGGSRNLLSCLPPHKSEFAFVLVKQSARTTDAR